MRAWLACLLPILAFGHFAYADDNGDYGPDWPVCQNLAGDPQAEITACKRLIDGGTLTPKHLSWAYNDRATAWLDLQRPDLAWSDFQKSIEADPTNHAPYYNLAGLYNQAGHFQEALDLYDKAIALGAPPPGAFCNRGAALQELGRMEQAIDSYQHELAARPNDDCALYRLTQLARDQHRQDVALAALDRAIATNPGDSESYHRRAILHAELGQTDLALSDYAEAIRLDPREAGALQGRAMLYRTLERYPEARADLDRTLAIGADEKGNLFLRAQVSFLMGDYDAAAADCARRLAILGQDAVCTGLQWRIAMRQGNFSVAAGYADTMVENHVEQFRLPRGVAYYAEGDLMKAAADFAAYTGATPGDPYGWLWLYLADRRLGREDISKLKEVAARRDAWPAMIIRHIAGLASAEDVLASADVPDPKLKRLRLAEANYYLGELAALAGDSAGAEALFRSSLAAGRAEIEPAMLLPVYKSDDDLELALANAALHGKGL